MKLRNSSLFSAKWQVFSSVIPSVVAVALSGGVGNAATVYWDNTGGTANDWGGLANWSTASGGHTNPTVIPGTTDIAQFSATNLAVVQTVNLNADRSVQGLIFSTALAHTLQGGGTDRTLTLGTSGISKTSTSTGAVTIGSATPGQQVPISLSAAQAWSNSNNTGAITINNGVTNATALTLTLSGTSTAANTIAGNITNGTGALAITKSGTGTWVLFGSNDYTGLTTISASGGALTIANGNALGSTSSGTVVNSGAALQIQGGISVGTEAITINGVGISNGGAIRNLSENNTLGGTITLGSTSRINSDSVTGTLTLSNNSAITGTNNLAIGGVGSTIVKGIISTGTGTLTKDGTGTLTLNGANTYTGSTTITLGVVRITNSDALGGTGGNTSISVINAALELNQTGDTPLSVAEPISLSGTATGIANGGAIRNIGGDNTISGAITLSGTPRINSDAGKLTLSSLGGLGTTTTFGGAGNILVSSAITSGALTKDGTGTLELSGALSYAGTTTAAGGTIRFTSAISDNSGITLNGGVVGLGNGNFTRSLGATATTVQWTGDGGFAAYTLDRTVNLGGAGATVTWNSGSFVPNLKALILGATDSDKTLSFQNPIDLNLGTREIRVNDGSAGVDAILSGAITNGGLTKTGTGILSLTGTNTYTGTTTISGGVLVANAANALNSNSGVTLDGGVLGLGAAGFSRSLGTAGTDVQWTTGDGGFAAYGSDRTVNLGGLSSAVTWASGSFVSSALIFGATSATNTVTFTNPINLAGSTREIRVDNSTTVGLVEAILTGALSNGGLRKTGDGTLQLNTTNSFTGKTTVNGGVLAYNVADALSSGDLTVDGTGATVNLGGFSDSVGIVTVANGGDITGGTLTSTGSFEVQGGSAAAVLAGSGINLNKTTAGTMTLTGINTYSGVTTISAGKLSINTIADGGDASTLGSSSSAATNLIFNGDGELQYTGLTDSSNRNFTITSALEGEVLVGKLAIFNVTAVDTNLTMTGASTNTIGNLTKTGQGTLTLTGSNLHTGTTTVLEGKLAYGASEVLSTGPITVNGPTAKLAIGEFIDVAGTVTLAAGEISGGTSGVLSSTGSFEMLKGLVTGVLGGSSPLNKTTSDTVTLTRVNTYTGITTISGGNLILGADASFANSPTIVVGDKDSYDAVLDVTAKNGSFTIGTNQTLMGIGTIDAGAGNTVTINGTHSPGNSPGIQPFTGDLAYSSTSIFKWELSSLVSTFSGGSETSYAEQTSGGGTRGTHFDGVNVTGDLAIDPDSIFKIVLPASYSRGDVFWDSRQVWNVFEIGGIDTGSFKKFEIWSAGVFVANGNDAYTYLTAPTGPGYFSFQFGSDGSPATTGNLVWSPVPEPTSALAGLLLGAGLLRRNRRQVQVKG